MSHLAHISDAVSFSFPVPMSLIKFYVCPVVILSEFFILRTEICDINMDLKPRTPAICLPRDDEQNEIIPGLNSPSVSFLSEFEGK